MNQLEEFYDYKNQLMEDIVTDETMVHLLDEDIVMEHAASLIYSQIFPYEYVPDTIEHGKTFLCCDVDIQRADSKTFFTPVIYIWVFTHRSKLRLPEGGVRTDKMCSRICELINGSMKYGLGELDLYSIKRFAPLTDFQGKVLTFTASDYNRLYDPNKYIPSRRK